MGRATQGALELMGITVLRASRPGRGRGDRQRRPRRRLRGRRPGRRAAGAEPDRPQEVGAQVMTQAASTSRARSTAAQFVADAAERRCPTRWSSPASARPPTTSSPPATATSNYYLWGAMGGADLARPGAGAGAAGQVGGRDHRRRRAADGHRQPGHRSRAKQPTNLTDRRARQRPLRRDRHAAQPHQPGHRPGRRRQGLRHRRRVHDHRRWTSSTIADRIDARSGPARRSRRCSSRPTSRRAPCRRATASPSRTASAPRSASQPF